MGDGVMLVFGAPAPDTDHAFHAVCCALLIQKLITHENELRKQRGLFPVQFRVGLNTGHMLAGNMGSRERMEYTVVGETVNLASRITSYNVCYTKLLRSEPRHQRRLKKVLAMEKRY